MTVSELFLGVIGFCMVLYWLFKLGYRAFGYLFPHKMGWSCTFRTLSPRGAPHKRNSGGWGKLRALAGTSRKLPKHTRGLSTLSLFVWRIGSCFSGRSKGRRKFASTMPA